MSKTGIILLGEDVNTLVCDTFSDGYVPLFEHIQEYGNPVSSRIGDTREVLNFKTVIREPRRRCTVASGRNTNIFFHLAESFWVLAGRNDLAFITLFNSRFPKFSDDGITLHGAYGKRLRHGGGTNLEKPGDQLFTLCKRLNNDPDLRRSVIALWDSQLDLGQPHRDIPCNTQLMFRISQGELHTTVINRSNDLHWGLIANIFQFSMLSEFMGLVIDRKFARQTHISQSLHYYIDNPLNGQLKNSDLSRQFEQRYPSSELTFPFTRDTKQFQERFSEIDIVIHKLPDDIMSFAAGAADLNGAIVNAEAYRSYGASFFDIARLLFFYIAYQYERQKDGDSVRQGYIAHLAALEPSFRHKDFWAMAINYFIARSKNGEAPREFGLLDVNLGNY
jgi:thymidylate synthase